MQLPVPLVLTDSQMKIYGNPNALPWQHAVRHLGAAVSCKRPITSCRLLLCAQGPGCETALVGAQHFSETMRSCFKVSKCYRRNGPFTAGHAFAMFMTCFLTETGQKWHAQQCAMTGAACSATRWTNKCPTTPGNGRGKSPQPLTPSKSGRQHVNTKGHQWCVSKSSDIYVRPTVPYLVPCQKFQQ